jgi:hypothetical protein
VLDFGSAAKTALFASDVEKGMDNVFQHPVRTHEALSSGIGMVSPRLTTLSATLVVNRLTFGFSLTRRDMSASYAFRTHSSYPSLDRRGRQTHLFGEALRGLSRVLLEEIQQLTVKSIEFHAARIIGCACAEKMRSYGSDRRESARRRAYHPNPHPLFYSARIA